MDSGQLFKHWSIPQAIFKQIHFCTTSSCRFSSLKETALIAVVPAHPGSAAATGSSGRLLRHRHIQQGRTSTPPNLRKTSRRDPLKLPGQGVLIISCPLFGYRHFPFIFLFTNGRHWPETWKITKLRKSWLSRRAPNPIRFWAGAQPDKVLKNKNQPCLDDQVDLSFLNLIGIRGASPFPISGGCHFLFISLYASG